MRKFLLVVPIILLLAGVYFFYQKNKVVVDSSPLIDGKAITIGVLLPSYKVERWKTDRDLITKKAKELGAYVNVVSADDDSDKQLLQAENMIDQKVNVLIVIAIDGEKAATIVEKAHAAGIKVIAYDRLIKNSPLDYYITFDNVKVGEEQAKAVLAVASKGNFAYIGGSSLDNNAFLVKQGSMNVLQSKISSGDVKVVVDSFTPSWKAEEAFKTMNAYLQKNKTVDAVVAANDSTAQGVIQALAKYGLVGKVPVSGQDASLGACQKIAEGKQTVTIYKPIKVIANKAVEQAVALVKEKTLDTNTVTTNGSYKVPSLLLDVIPVTKDNLMTTVISDGFLRFDDVYANIPVGQRPKR